MQYLDSLLQQPMYYIVVYTSQQYYLSMVMHSGTYMYIQVNSIYGNA